MLARFRTGPCATGSATPAASNQRDQVFQSSRRSKGNFNRSAALVMRLRPETSFGLQTGNSCSDHRRTTSSPAQWPSPWRTARSTSSRAKSTACVVADTRKSIPGWASANRSSRCTSHLAAKSGEVLTVKTPEVWRCSRRSVPTAIRSSASRTTAR